MYEAMTYETILKRMLKEVPDGIDKREGSMIYTAVAPAATELAIMYIELDHVLKEMFADTADREHLMKRASERGVIPRAASCAELKAVFNTDIPIGSRFSLDMLNYRAVERLESKVYRMKCETKGAVGNSNFGALIPITYIKGLTSSVLTELLIPGEDEEETEHFRKRYFNSLSSQAFGGNIADYKEKVSAVNGVGAVKVYPVWNGGGTVKVVIVDSDFRTPSVDLVQTVQQILDPLSDQGKGKGMAPIGHVVTVAGAEAIPVSLSTAITYQPGYDKEGCEENIHDAIDAYLDELNRSWEGVRELVVRISRIESRLLDVEGILDVTGTMIQGTTGNYVLPSDKLAVRGEIIV